MTDEENSRCYEIIHTAVASATEGIGWYVTDDFADKAKKRITEIRRLEQERKEAEARRQSIRQMLMSFVASVLLAVMCGFDCVVLHLFNVSSLLVNIFSGILIVGIVDALMYLMCLKNITKIESAAQIIFFSNFVAAVINIAGSLIYLAYDAEASAFIKGIIADTDLGKGKIIIDSIMVFSNMPFLNLGLVIVVSCWLVFLVIRKHTTK